MTDHHRCSRRPRLRGGDRIRCGGRRRLLRPMSATISPSKFADAEGKIACLKHDVTSEDDWQRIVDACSNDWGRIDVLVNNAGVHQPASMLDTDVALLRSASECKCAVGFPRNARGFAANDGTRSPGPLSTSPPGAGAKGTAGIFAYSTSKWAVRGMTRSAARERLALTIFV